VSTLTKVFIVLASVLSIALSCLFIAAAAQWANWKDLAQKYQEARDAAIVDKQSTAASMQAALALKDEALAAQGRELVAVRDQLKKLQNDFARLQSDLAQAKNEALAFEAGRAKLQEILGVTTGELKSVQKQNQTLLSQNMDLQSRGARLNARVLELTTNVSILQDQIRNMQEKLYAAEHGIAQRQRTTGAGEVAMPPAPAGVAVTAPAVAGEIRGQVTQVTGIYAEINVGESAGVAPGMTFMVYREGGTYLADLVIERVEPNAAGGKLTTLVKGDVKPGDAVIYGIQ